MLDSVELAFNCIQSWLLTQTQAQTQTQTEIYGRHPWNSDTKPHSESWSSAHFCILSIKTKSRKRGSQKKAVPISYFLPPYVEFLTQILTFQVLAHYKWRTNFCSPSVNVKDRIKSNVLKVLLAMSLWDHRSFMLQLPFKTLWKEQSPTIYSSAMKVNERSRKNEGKNAIRRISTEKTNKKCLTKNILYLKFNTWKT